MSLLKILEHVIPALLLLVTKHSIVDRSTPEADAKPFLMQNIVKCKILPNAKHTSKTHVSSTKTGTLTSQTVFRLAQISE